MVRIKRAQYIRKFCMLSIPPEMLGLIDDITLSICVDPFLGFRTDRTTNVDVSQYAKLDRRQIPVLLSEQFNNDSSTLFYEMISLFCFILLCFISKLFWIVYSGGFMTILWYRATWNWGNGIITKKPSVRPAKFKRRLKGKTWQILNNCKVFPILIFFYFSEFCGRSIYWFTRGPIGQMWWWFFKTL